MIFLRYMNLKNGKFDLHGWAVVEFQTQSFEVLSSDPNISMSFLTFSFYHFLPLW